MKKGEQYPQNVQRQLESAIRKIEKAMRHFDRDDEDCDELARIVHKLEEILGDLE